MRQASFVRIVSLFSLIALMSGAIPLGAAAKGGDAPGNSGVAHACQKGGWEMLARDESPTVPFVNQDECVSYGAHGFAVVDLIPYNPMITATFAPTGDPAFCSVFVNLTGFAGDTEYTVSPMIREGGIPFYYSSFTVLTDKYGSATQGWGSYVDTDYSFYGDSYVNFSSNGVESGFTEILC